MKRSALWLAIWVMLWAASLTHAEKTEDFLRSIETGNTKEFQKLLKKGVSPNSADSAGHSAVILAIYYNRPEMLSELIHAKANLAVLWNEDHLTPVLLALYKKRPEMAAMLIAAGADVNGKDKEGLTALWWAAFRDYTDTCTGLIKAGADLNITDGEQRLTPLMLAAVKGNLAVTRALIDAKAQINAQDRSQTTALVMAVQGKHPEVAVALLSAGADPTIADESKSTAMHAASSEGLVQVIQALLNAGVDVNTKNEEGVTPILFAAQENQLDAVRALIQAKADVNVIAGKMKNTALHVAAAHGYTDVCLALIEAGARVNTKNLIGLTPLKMAADAQHEDTMEALKKAGGK